MSKKRKAFIHVGLPGGPGDFLEIALRRHAHALAALGVREPGSVGGRDVPGRGRDHARPPRLGLRAPRGRGHLERASAGAAARAGTPSWSASRCSPARRRADRAALRRAGRLRAARRRHRHGAGRLDDGRRPDPGPGLRARALGRERAQARAGARPDHRSRATGAGAWRRSAAPSGSAPHRSPWPAWPTRRPLARGPPRPERLPVLRTLAHSWIDQLADRARTTYAVTSPTCCAETRRPSVA